MKVSVQFLGWEVARELLVLLSWVRIQIRLVGSVEFGPFGIHLLFSFQIAFRIATSAGQQRQRIIVNHPPKKTSFKSGNMTSTRGACLSSSLGEVF